MSGRRARGIDELAAACRLLGQRGGMPSFRHEAPLVLFRECPELVARLMRELFGVVVPDYREVRVVDADFTQLVPTSFHAEPELAVFSALVHGNGRHGLDVVVPALSAVEALPDDYANLCFDIIVGTLTEARRRGLEARMRTTDYEYQTEFARRYLAQGSAKGEAKGRADALLAVLAARGLEPSEQQERTIRQCTNLPTLDRWIARAASADAVGDVLD